MSNIDKALRSTSERDWFEDWFKREFHPEKTGPYIKDQLFFAIRAARAPLLDELEAKDKRIAELQAMLARLYAECDTGERRGNGSQSGVAMPSWVTVEAARLLLGVK